MFDRPVCAYSGCSDVPLVQWQRRPNAGEIAALVDAEQQRRQRIIATAKPLEIPVFGRLPTVEDTVLAVYACGDHAIHLDHATRVHGPDCQAPHPDHLPGCDCTPEPLAGPDDYGTPVTLPTGWTVQAQATT